MGKTESCYGIKIECIHNKVCIQTSRAYLSRDEFEDWVRKTREFIQEEAGENKTGDI